MFLINLLVSIFIRQLFRILNGFQRLLGKFTDIHKPASFRTICENLLVFFCSSSNITLVVSTVKGRVLIFYEEFVKTFFLKFSCKHIFLADLPVLCYIYYQQLDLFFNYKPCIYMKVESNL